MMKLETMLRDADARYYTLYVKMRAWAVSLWTDHIDVPEQVRHGPGHSAKMMEYAGIILGKKSALDRNFLRGADLFLLAAAFYLHDIGMQTGWREHLDIPRSRGELTAADRKKIRDKHAETGERVIRSFKDDLPGGLARDLDDGDRALLTDELVEALAVVCGSHNRRGLEDYLKKEIPRRFPDTGLKISLAAAVVQLCDALHMDRSRLNERRFADELKLWLKNKPMEADYSDKEWIRFFQCHYVENVRVEARGEDGTVFQLFVDVCFHPDEKDAVREWLLKVYGRRLANERKSCVSVLNEEADIHFWSDDPFVLMPPDKTKAVIPEKLLDFFEEPTDEGKVEIPDKLLHLSEEPPVVRQWWKWAVPVVVVLIAVVVGLFLMGPVDVIRGRVTDAGSGDAIAGVRVEIAGVGTVVTDGAGRFEVEVPRGKGAKKYRGRFSKEGYDPKTNIELIGTEDEEGAGVMLSKVKK